jgi:hypothetical protein
MKMSFLDKHLQRIAGGEREGTQTNGKWTRRLTQRALAHSKPEGKVR